MRYLPACAFALFLAMFSGVPAFAQSSQDLANIINSRICPANLQTYKDKDFSECQPLPRTVDRVLCQDRVIAENHVIYKYNNFIRQCRRAGASQETRPPGSGGKWSQKAKTAQERNSTIKRSSPNRDAVFQRDVNRASEHNERIMKENARKFERERKAAEQARQHNERIEKGNARKFERERARQAQADAQARAQAERRNRNQNSTSRPLRLHGRTNCGLPSCGIR